MTRGYGPSWPRGIGGTPTDERVADWCSWREPTGNKDIVPTCTIRCDFSLSRYHGMMKESRRRHVRITAREREEKRNSGIAELTLSESFARNST